MFMNSLEMHLSCTILNVSFVLLLVHVLKVLFSLESIIDHISPYVECL